MLLGSAPRRSLHRMAGAAMVLGLAILGSGSPAAALPPPVPASARPDLPVPVITLGFDDGTADQMAVAQMLDQQRLLGVFYVNSGRLDNPGYLTLDQVRQMQSAGHEIGGHTVAHLQLSQQDSAEQKRAVCVDRNQLLAAGIEATDFAYPFSDPDDAGSLASACGYQSARTTDGIGCPDCPAAESIPAGDRFRTRALSGFGPDTTAGDLEDAVEQTLGADGWLQMVFHRICTTSCDRDAVRVSELAEFVAWLAERRDAGDLRNETVRQALNNKVLPGVAPPEATAKIVAFQNNSFEEPGATADAPARCFTSDQAAVWTRVADPRHGKVALQAVLPPDSTGSRLVTTQDLGSCAPPIRADAHYQVGFWYKATQPIKVTTYARRPLGGYRAFGSATLLPASPTWSPASWTIGPTPDNDRMALSLGISVKAGGTYTFDDFALLPRAERLPPAAAVKRAPIGKAKPILHPRRKHTKARPVARPAAKLNPSREPVAAFVPPDLNPPLPAADPQPAGQSLTGPPAWLGYGEIAGAILLAFAAVIVLDRRFRHLHRRTRLRIPRERRSGLRV